MYSFTSLQSKATASKPWKKAKRLNLKLLKAIVVHKRLTWLNCKSRDALTYYHITN